jgi:hypothetical protein
MDFTKVERSHVEKALADLDAGGAEHGVRPYLWSAEPKIAERTELRFR